jgi:transposase
MTEAEWRVLEPLLRAPDKLGRPRSTDLRSVVDGILYMTTTGCQWRLLPKDFPPMSAVQWFFYRWRDDGTWDQINHLLVIRTREMMGREASPSSGAIDSQSVKTTEVGRPRGYNAGKCIKSRKHNFLIDTNGLLVGAVIGA